MMKLLTPYLALMALLTAVSLFGVEPPESPFNKSRHLFEPWGLGTNPTTTFIHPTEAQIKTAHIHVRAQLIDQLMLSGAAPRGSDAWSLVSPVKELQVMYGIFRDPYLIRLYSDFLEALHNHGVKLKAGDALFHYEIMLAFNTHLSLTDYAGINNSAKLRWLHNGFQRFLTDSYAKHYGRPLLEDLWDGINGDGLSLIQQFGDQIRTSRSNRYLAAFCATLTLSFVVGSHVVSDPPEKTLYRSLQPHGDGVETHHDESTTAQDALKRVLEETRDVSESLATP